MNFEFTNKDLWRLYTEDAGKYKTRFPAQVIEEFFVLMGEITAAPTEQDMRMLVGRRWEKLQGQRKHQCSMKLNSQYRLIFQLGADIQGEPILYIEDIEDYH